MYPVGNSCSKSSRRWQASDAHVAYEELFEWTHYVVTETDWSWWLLSNSRHYLWEFCPNVLPKLQVILVILWYAVVDARKCKKNWHNSGNLECLQKRKTVCKDCSVFAIYFVLKKNQPLFFFWANKKKILSFV